MNRALCHLCQKSTPTRRLTGFAAAPVVVYRASVCAECVDTATGEAFEAGALSVAGSPIAQLVRIAEAA